MGSDTKTVKVTGDSSDGRLESKKMVYHAVSRPFVVRTTGPSNGPIKDNDRGFTTPDLFFITPMEHVSSRTYI